MKHTLEELKSKSDAELLEMLGFKNQLDEFKESLAEAEKLKGKAKEHVEDRVNEMLTPRIYPGDLKYAVKSAQRKTAEGEKNYCGCDILD